MATFGFTGTAPANINFIVDEMIGSIFTCPEDGWGQSISANIVNWAGHIERKIKYALYDVDNMALIAYTEEKTGVGAVDGLVTLNFVSIPQLFANKKYLLLAWSNGYLQIGTVLGGTEYHATSPYNGFPEIFVELWNTGRTVGIYCTYSTEPPPPQKILSITAVRGTTEPAVGDYYVNEGEQVQVTALGKFFDYWEFDGNNIGNMNPVMVTMDTDHTLNAVFVEVPPIPTHMLTVDSTPIQGVPFTIERVS